MHIIRGKVDRAGRSLEKDQLGVDGLRVGDGGLKARREPDERHDRLATQEPLRASVAPSARSIPGAGTVSVAGVGHLYTVKSLNATM